MDLFSDLTPQHTKGVIIHHWDTDGMASAALLRSYFSTHFPDKKIELFVPTITNYYLTDEQYLYFQQQGYQFAITCDINFQKDTVDGLAKTFPGQVYIFDHHHQAPYTNVHYYNEPHPACASYINDILGFPNTLQSAIAIVGDKEEAIQQDTEFYPRVREMMAEYHLTFTQMLEARRLIDSNYIVDDYEGIAETVHLLEHDPAAIFSDVRLQDNIERINSTMAELSAKTPETLSDKVVYMEIDTPMNILSHITRNLSREYPDKVIFTRQHKNGQVTCYARRRDLEKVDMRTMIAFARELGLNSGGKEDVVGIIIPDETMNEFFPKVQQRLVELANESH